MDKNDLRKKYDEVIPFYKRAAQNTIEALKIFLEEEKISYLAIPSRIKEFDTFCNKVTSKNYNDPFKENTDFAGIRIILYYPKDIELVSNLINREFEIIESENKAETFQVNEFGYRSSHFIVRIKKPWLAAPNYRGLDDISVEIQVRTILMHAWAEIEHKLQYKSTVQVPRELQRKLFLLSAKFEEADGQFQDLKGDIDTYRNKVAEKIAATGTFDTSLELNLDTLNALFKYSYPHMDNDYSFTSEFLDEVTVANLSLKDVVECIEKFRPYEKTLKTKVEGILKGPSVAWYALEVFADGFWDKVKCSDERNDIIQELRNLAIKS